MCFVEYVSCGFLCTHLFLNGLVSKNYAVDGLLDCFESAVSVLRGGNWFAQKVVFEAGRVTFLPSKEEAMYILEECRAAIGEQELLCADKP